MYIKSSKSASKERQLKIDYLLAAIKDQAKTKKQLQLLQQLQSLFEQELNAAADVLQESQTETRIKAGDYSDGFRYLDDGTTVCFKTKNGSEVDVSIDRDTRDVHISTSMGGHTLVIRPHVTNVVTITSEPW